MNIIMNKQLQDTILEFTHHAPHTISEIVDHIYLTLQVHVSHKTLASNMRGMHGAGLVKQRDKRRIGMALCNTYKAASTHDREELAKHNLSVTTQSPGFANDPLLAAFYGKQNI